MKVTEKKSADAVTVQEIAEARRALREGLQKSVADQEDGGIWGSPYLPVSALNALRALGVDVRDYGHMDTVEE